MKKMIQVLHRAELYFSMFGIVVLTVSVFIGAFARTIGHPLAWTTDIGMLMLAWSTFLGGDIAFREGRLANLDIVLAKFPVKVQKIIVSIEYLIIISFLSVIIYYGFKLTWTTRFRTFNGVHHFSYSWVTVSMPISAVFMLTTAFTRYIKLMKCVDSKTLAKF